MNKVLTAASATILSTSLLVMSGCTWDKQDTGTAVGAVAGGVVGNVVTGGSAAGTIAGAVGGGYVGRQVTK
ncbi:MAG: hypothetical protein ACD_60C00138G0005 [uncultured bacterium]|nr:MAG: hypothetical protein ACD_60C00138G0005 [uncultured bacterium]